MKIGLTRRIWITVAIIVLFFTVLVLYIVPKQQEKYFIESFHKEAENLASTVAMMVEIALRDENFQGVQTAMNFAMDDSRIEFVAMLQVDTVWNEAGTEFELQKEVMMVNPPGKEISPQLATTDSMIIKLAPFQVEEGQAEIMAGFRTQEIKQKMDRIRIIAIIVSIVVFIFGILLGLWLARTISRPVLAIRDAAIRVGQGDLSQKVSTRSKDEIGELSLAFNKMVDDLSEAEDKIRQKNQALMHTLEDLEEKNEQLGAEKKRSDELLLNILPEKTAEELKLYGKSKPTFFDNVSVMFVDFSRFTKIAETLSPVELVTELDYCFREFDRIITEHNLEKIKTIGDAYLCVGGLPIPTGTHAFDTIQAGLKIQQFLQQHKAERQAQGLPFFEARIGLHSGPVVAGIVGIKKFAFDIWGDTVNTASRLEERSEPGRVNISEATYRLAKNQLVVIPRGKIAAKNKGEVEMYFVEGVKEAEVPV